MGKIFTNPSSDKGLISKIYKVFKKLDSKILNNPIKKWGTELNRDFSTEEFQMILKDQKILKDMFNFFSYQRSENQNNSEIPSYTCQNG